MQKSSWLMKPKYHVAKLVCSWNLMFWRRVMTSCVHSEIYSQFDPNRFYSQGDGTHLQRHLEIQPLGKMSWSLDMFFVYGGDPATKPYSCLQWSICGPMLCARMLLRIQSAFFSHLCWWRCDEVDERQLNWLDVIWPWSTLQQVVLTNLISIDWNTCCCKHNHSWLPTQVSVQRHTPRNGIIGCWNVPS